MSHNSARSHSVKQDARTRPDVVWRDADGNHEQRLDIGQPQSVVTGGTELSKLITEADAHLVAMRKIVQ